MKGKKKKGISPTLILAFLVDIVVAWYVYDFYIAGEKVSAYVLVGAYGLIRIILLLRTITRMKRKKDFDRLYPDN